MTFKIKDQDKNNFIVQLCKNYVNLKHCVNQKFNVKVIKAAHLRSNFSKTFVSQEIFVNIGLRKKSFKIPKILGLENVNSIFVTNLVNAGKKLETKLQYFDIYLHNKNILEYA